MRKKDNLKQFLANKEIIALILEEIAMSKKIFLTIILAFLLSNIFADYNELLPFQPLIPIAEGWTKHSASYSDSIYKDILVYTENRQYDMQGKLKYSEKLTPAGVFIETHSYLYNSNGDTILATDVNYELSDAGDSVIRTFYYDSRFRMAMCKEEYPKSPQNNQSIYYTYKDSSNNSIMSKIVFDYNNNLYDSTRYLYYNNGQKQFELYYLKNYLWFPSGGYSIKEYHYNPQGKTENMFVSVFSPLGTFDMATVDINYIETILMANMAHSYQFEFNETGNPVYQLTTNYPGQYKGVTAVQYSKDGLPVTISISDTNGENSFLESINWDSMHRLVRQETECNAGYKVIEKWDYDPVFAGTARKTVTIPEKLEIAAFPNPFREKLTVAFKEAPGSDISLSIINSTGQILENINLSGRNSFEWNSQSLPNGTYLLVINCSNRIITKKMTLLK